MLVNYLRHYYTSEGLLRRYSDQLGVDTIYGITACWQPTFAVILQ